VPAHDGGRNAKY